MSSSRPQLFRAQLALRGRDPTRWAPLKVTREEFHFVAIKPHFFDTFVCPVCSDLLASDFGLLHVFQRQYACNLEHFARMDAQRIPEDWLLCNAQGRCCSCGRIPGHWLCSICDDDWAHPCRAPGCDEEVCRACGNRWLRGLHGDLFQWNRLAAAAAQPGSSSSQARRHI